jgi:hypothetical protein
MPDYGHPITFGLSLYPSVGLVAENRRLTQAADAAVGVAARESDA